MRALPLGMVVGAVVVAIGCTRTSIDVPHDEAPRADAAPVEMRAANFCTIELVAPEAWQATLAADDVAGVDCVPPAGGELFSLGFAHAGWWMQLDIARRSLVVGAPRPLDGQAALLALDCWQWDGSVTVDADDAARWAVRLDVRCRGEARTAIVGSFDGERR